jgi:hypothetical protein
MAYTFDVFISYRRQRNKSEWLIEHFLPLFEEYLSDEIIAICGRPPQDIFFDQAKINPELRQFDNRLGGIEPGADWRMALADAIRQSRCMVGIWSPGYFLSEWCCVEWKSFEARHQQTQLQTIVPLSVHDGKTFPPEARKPNIVDLSDYMIVGEGFRKSEKFVTFQDHVKLFARSVANTINSAPAFSTWPVEDNTPAAAALDTISLTTFANATK